MCKKVSENKDGATDPFFSGPGTGNVLRGSRAPPKRPLSPKYEGLIRDCETAGPWMCDTNPFSFGPGTECPTRSPRAL